MSVLFFALAATIAFFIEYLHSSAPPAEIVRLSNESRQQTPQATKHVYFRWAHGSWFQGDLRWGATRSRKSRKGNASACGLQRMWG